MSGIFPNSGVGASAATNAINVPQANLTPGCEALFASTNRCQPRFDPSAFNAIISELTSVTICAGLQYDCTKLDNLCKAIKELIKITTPDLCSLPNVPDVDADDTLAGCFDGVTGKATVASVLALVPTPTPFSVCSLPAATLPDLDDTLAGCFDGVQGLVTVQSILDLAAASVSAPVGYLAAGSAGLGSVNIADGQVVLFGIGATGSGMGSVDVQFATNFTSISIDYQSSGPTPGGNFKVLRKGLTFYITGYSTVNGGGNNGDFPLFITSTACDATGACTVTAPAGNGGSAGVGSQLYSPIV